jgi:DNA-binding HxlR family transcriptional regulator
MDSPHIYRHFCMMARALEIVGERWSLLIVRDLLLGPQRFTDLVASVAGITPTRLTDRLRHLEATGIVEREKAQAGSEVWYRLTEAGNDLAPVVESLIKWGQRHAFDSPRPDEPVPPAPAMLGTKVFLGGHARLPAGPIAWVWRLGADGTFTMRFEGSGWTLARGEAETANVIVETSLDIWARFLTMRGSRTLPCKGIRLIGSKTAVKDFAAAFNAELKQSGAKT